MSVLAALADGRALPVGTLAAETGLSSRAVREQVAALVAHGRVEVIVSGSHRYFRSAPDARADVPGLVVRSLREGTAAYDLRLARRCYGHLAGRLGVAVTDAVRASGWIEGPTGDVDLASHARRAQRLAGGVVDPEVYRVTGAGRDGLGALGVRVPAGREVRCCVDWTEQRHHLAGPLGTALLDAFVARGWVGSSPTARALTVSGAGIAGFARSLGIGWPPPARADLARLPRAEFGFPGPLRDRLVAAILRGDKVSTTTLVRAYEVCGDPLPRPGERSVLVGSRDVPVALLQTTAVAVVPLGEVDLTHARDEGESHHDVASWRRGHERFWHSADMRAALGDPAFTVDDSTPVVLERFRVVWRYVAAP